MTEKEHQALNNLVAIMEETSNRDWQEKNR